MIELIEIPLYNFEMTRYKKCLMAILSSEVITGWDRVLLLESKNYYPLPISKKRWKLLKKFTKEGCCSYIVSRVSEPGRKYRQKIRLNLESVVKLAGITDNRIIKELKKS
jgi:hypothetical protein